MANPTESTETGDDLKDRRFVLVLTAVLVGFGLLAIACFEILSCDYWCQRFKLFGAATALAGASFTFGALLGLLFGIPRGSTHDEKGSGSKGLATNTNLIQISDWLTKALVGVTLTQFYKIPTELMKISDFFKKDIGSGPVAVAVLIHFATSGFLSGYLLTRVVLQQAFHRADQVPDEAQAGLRSSPTVSVADDPSPPAPKRGRSKVGGT